MARVWELVGELAEYERLSDTVTGSAEDLGKHAFDERAIDVFVLETEGQIVGYTISFSTFSTFRCRPGIWLEDVYVTPAFRGRGFGRALVENIIALNEAHGGVRTEWSVLDWNEPAIKFYEQMGSTILPDWRIVRHGSPSRQPEE